MSAPKDKLEQAVSVTPDDADADQRVRRWLADGDGAAKLDAEGQRGEGRRVRDFRRYNPRRA